MWPQPLRVAPTRRLTRGVVLPAAAYVLLRRRCVHYLTSCVCCDLARLAVLCRAALCHAVLQDARKGEAKLSDRFRAASQSQQAVEDRLAGAEQRLTELGRELDAKNGTIRWLESQVGGWGEVVVMTGCLGAGGGGGATGDCAL